MGLFKYWEARFFLAPFFINCTYKTREYRFWNKFRITWATRIRNVYDISKVRERTTERLFSESQLWLYCYNEYFITQKSERSFLLGVIEGILFLSAKKRIPSNFLPTLTQSCILGRTCSAKCPLTQHGLKKNRINKGINPLAIINAGLHGELIPSSNVF